MKKTDGEMHDSICYEAEGFKTENPDDFSAFQQCFLPVLMSQHTVMSLRTDGPLSPK